mgnify:CR=1 FL=1
MDGPDRRSCRPPREPCPGGSPSPGRTARRARPGTGGSSAPRRTPPRPRARAARGPRGRPGRSPARGAARSARASISSVRPLKVLPSITNPPLAGSGAPRWRLESHPRRLPTRSSPSRWGRSKKNADSGTSAASRPTSSRLPNRLIVSWNGLGCPSGRSAIASPSRTADRTGSPATAATTSGTRAVASARFLVKTRTSPASRWTWILAPSRFHSTAAGPAATRPRGPRRRRRASARGAGAPPGRTGRAPGSPRPGRPRRRPRGPPRASAPAGPRPRARPRRGPPPPPSRPPGLPAGPRGGGGPRGSAAPPRSPVRRGPAGARPGPPVMPAPSPS